MPAVKANAYGHGLLPVARTLEAAGVSWLAVATPEEALKLRQGGVNTRILLMLPAFHRIDELIDAQVDLTVSGRESLAAVTAAGRGARVHLKVDTGLGRLGMPPDEAALLARELDADPRVEFAAVWTHFATADEPANPFAATQLERFQELLARLGREGTLPPLKHAANSAATLSMPDAHFDLVRPGIALYGYPPSPMLAGLLDLKPVMTVYAPVTHVKRVPAGTPVSYGSTWRAARETQIATARIGYADGYPRLLGNRAHALLAGRRVPVVGRVCMDQLMLDAGDLAVQVGDEVALFGSEGPTAWELASLLDTIPYELLTMVGGRVERKHLLPATPGRAVGSG